MYAFIIILFIAAGAALTILGTARRKWGVIAAGAAVWVFTALFFGLLGFWGEMYWFAALGFSSRFWTVIQFKAGLCAVGAMMGGLLVYLLTLMIPSARKIARIWPETAGALFGAMIGFNSWQTVLIFLNRVKSGVQDPILGMDTGFYLFALPFYDLLYGILLLAAFISLLAALAAAFLRIRDEEVKIDIPAYGRIYRPVNTALAALLIVLAWGFFLERFHLLQSRLGVVAGAGWTDVHVRMPALATVGAVAALAGVVLLIPPLQRRFVRLVRRKIGRDHTAELVALIAPPAAAAAVWFIGLGLLPGLAQWLRVEPNEITMERDYIEHNIEFTRRGFDMHHSRSSGPKSITARSRARRWSSTARKRNSIIRAGTAMSIRIMPGTAACS